jgi:DNA-binding transcriptional regulator GbsR (MarR family)
MVYSLNLSKDEIQYIINKLEDENLLKQRLERIIKNDYYISKDDKEWKQRETKVIKIIKHLNVGDYGLEEEGNCVYIILENGYVVGKYFLDRLEKLG